MTGSTYDVVLLVEQAMSDLDARQVRGLHEEITEQVRYHVLQPVDDAAERIESAMGALATGDALAGPPLAMDPDDVEELQHELLHSAREELNLSLTALRGSGAEAIGEIVTEEPVHALVDKVKEVGGAEVIVLTRPHVVAEFFHLDWTSRARRKLGVPVLHLLEHERFDEQAGGGEGVIGV
jgi:hypothetical protein